MFYVFYVCLKESCFDVLFVFVLYDLLVWFVCWYCFVCCLCLCVVV